MGGFGKGRFGAVVGLVSRAIGEHVLGEGETDGTVELATEDFREPTDFGEFNVF